MTTSETTSTPAAAATTDPREAIGERIFAGAIASNEMLTVYLGVDLGLYDALKEHGPATARELASRTGIAELYAQ